MRERSRAGRTVLVVDDSADLQEALGDVLSDSGYIPVLVSNGCQALKHLRKISQEPAPSEEIPALILLDLMMPVMDGAQLLTELVQDPLLARIPVVVLSAEGQLPQRVVDLAPAGYLPKPVQLDALLETVATFCDGPEPTSS